MNMHACIGDRNIVIHWIKHFCLALQVTRHQKSTSTCLVPRREDMKTFHTLTFITHNILPVPKHTLPFTYDTNFCLLHISHYVHTHFTHALHIQCDHLTCLTLYLPLVLSTIHLTIYHQFHPTMHLIIHISRPCIPHMHTYIASQHLDDPFTSTLLTLRPVYTCSTAVSPISTFINVKNFCSHLKITVLSLNSI